MLGVFHFSTVNLAGGNIFLFEENMESSNNIIIKIDHLRTAQQAQSIRSK